MTFPGRKYQAFTLIEVMVSCAVLMVIGVLSYAILNSIMSAWKMQKARLSTFEAARVGFEALSARLSQATLNTYWDYDDPENPQRYIRQSELHFILDQASDLLPAGYLSSTQAVFFVAPLGHTERPEYQPLVKMLTACGFYISFSQDTDRPSFLPVGRIPLRYRYRLYQLYEPGEELSIYDHSSGVPWYQAHLNAQSFPMIENVIGLVIRAKYPSGTGIIETYHYDSHSVSTSPTSNQLPPTLSVTLVVMDEDSARRLDQGSSPPDILPASGSFTNINNYDTDLAAWENKLKAAHVNYRIFSSDIPIRGAKWSSN